MKRVQILNDEELGKLIFYNYRESDNLQEMIHGTTVLLKKMKSKYLIGKFPKYFRMNYWIVMALFHFQ